MSNIPTSNVNSFNTFQLQFKRESCIQSTLDNLLTLWNNMADQSDQEKKKKEINHFITETQKINIDNTLKQYLKAYALFETNLEKDNNDAYDILKNIPGTVKINANHQSLKNLLGMKKDQIFTNKHIHALLKQILIDKLAYTLDDGTVAKLVKTKKNIKIV